MGKLFHCRADERHHDTVVVVVANVFHQLADVFSHQVVVDGVFHLRGLHVLGVAVFFAVKLLLLHKILLVFYLSKHLLLTHLSLNGMPTRMRGISMVISMLMDGWQLAV